MAVPVAAPPPEEEPPPVVVVNPPPVEDSRVVPASVAPVPARPELFVFHWDGSPVAPAEVPPPPPVVVLSLSGLFCDMSFVLLRYVNHSTQTMMKASE